MNLPYDIAVSLPSGRHRLHETALFPKAKIAIAKKIAKAKEEKLFCSCGKRVLHGFVPAFFHFSVSLIILRGGKKARANLKTRRILCRFHNGFGHTRQKTLHKVQKRGASYLLGVPGRRGHKARPHNGAACRQHNADDPHDADCGLVFHRGLLFCMLVR